MKFKKSFPVSTKSKKKKQYIGQEMTFEHSKWQP